jgi:hypothetical protein
MVDLEYRVAGGTDSESAIKDFFPEKRTLIRRIDQRLSFTSAVVQSGNNLRTYHYLPRSWFDIFGDSVDVLAVFLKQKQDPTPEHWPLCPSILKTVSVSFDRLLVPMMELTEIERKG